MAKGKYAKAEKAFVEYIAELLKALYDLTDEDLQELAQKVADRLEGLKEEYEYYLGELDGKIQALAEEYSSYKEENGLTDQQMATLIKGAVRAEYNQAKGEFEDYCSQIAEAIKNMTIYDYKKLYAKIKAYRRELEDYLDELKFEVYEELAALCEKFEQFKKENGLTQKEAIAFVENALQQRFGKASKAYEKFRVEFLKAKYNVTEEEIAAIDKKMAAAAEYVEGQYKALAEEAGNRVKAALAEIKSQIPSDKEIVNEYAGELIAAIKSKLK